MPDTGPQRERSTTTRSDAARRADHASIARLTDDLLPALIAKLGSTNLGELEVREGDWQVRLRRPYGVGPGEGRRSSDRPSRTQPGHEGHGHGRAAPEGRARSGSSSSGVPGPTGTTAGSGAASASSNGTGRPGGIGSGHGPGSGAGGGAGDGADRSRTVATSPAVGIFQPGPRAASGTRVRAGDALGTVNVIGVPQDVTAPADGIVGSTLVEGGTAVEYGQELIRIELTAPAEAR